ncbi:Phosphatidylinositolglycan class N-domain-containing protein [Russula vinacea]|nr:Phosphatidylinositolglycan class N-domain-containing protein [Russula vinacea]
MTSSSSIAGLLVFGIVFHLVYIGTVFDCYFASPVVHGMRQYKLPRAQAKRLVLIVGARTQLLCFTANASQIVPGVPERVAPYLRDIVENRGAYGVSHTHVPTESRPGHVAIIGGMYEDVSAVTKVDFDSVFNQSSHTFSFGSPDILPMFVQGAIPGRVDGWTYHADDEDFTKDATELDVWVLDKLKLLFRNATMNEALDAQLRAPQVVFFLHLLGLDTTGHAYRPHSKEYMNNIRVVDDIVRQTEQLMSEFYGDQETSYVFTADHGMSRIGNHGDGDPDNTRTPLVAWGAGIRSPIRNPNQIPDDYSASWGLSHIVRHDVEQADVAALMSALLGTYWPVNSVGVLPDHRTKEGPSVLYKPYRFSITRHLSGISRSQHMAFIERLITSGDFQQARHQSHELIKTTLSGLRYLETYDRTLIRTIVTFAYTGWIAFIAAFILAPSQPLGAGSAPFWIRFLFNLAAIGSSTAVDVPHLHSISVFFWMDVAEKVHANWSALRGLGFGNVRWTWSVLLRLFLAVVALQSMVFGYTNRAVWSVGFVAIGLIWPMASWPEKQRGKLFWPWAVGCFVSAVFPLLRVDPLESLGTIISGGICMLAVGELAVRRISKLEDTAPASARGTKLSFGRTSRIQLLLVALSMYNTVVSVTSLQGRHGLPFLNQVAGWIIFGVTRLAFPLFSFFFTTTAPRTAEGRLLTYFLSFCRALMDDVRIALFFLFFVQVGFFGTGKSFYLEPVYRLVPKFNPLTDGSWLQIGQSISHFCITSLLLVFSAGIASVGETLMRGAVPRRPEGKREE